MALAPSYGGGAGPRTQRLPQPGPGALGPVAEGVGEVGEALYGAARNRAAVDERILDSDHRLAMLEKDRQQAMDRARHLVGLAEMEQRLRSKDVELQTSLPADAYASTFKQALNEEADAYLGQIDDPELQKEFWPRVATMGGQLKFAADLRQANMRGEEAKSAWSGALDTWGQVVYLDPLSPATLKRADEALTALIDRDNRTDDTTKKALHQIRKNTLARQVLLGSRSVDPDAGLNLLRKGVFGGWLDTDELSGIEGTLEAESRRRANAAEAQIGAAREELREQIGLASARQSNGEVLPDGELATLQDGAGRLKLEKEEYNVGGWRIRNNVNRQTKPWKPADYESRINALRAKGETVTPDEAIELNQLEKIAPRRIDEYKKNPAGYAAAVGRPAPPLDLADRGSIRARTAWALGPGRGAFLTPEEAAPLTELVRGSSGERRQAAEALMRFEDARAIRGAAEIVAPHDGAFKVAVRMSTLPNRQVAAQRMRWALDGPSYRQSNKEVVDEERARGVFVSDALPAIHRMGADYIEGVFQTSLNIHASRMTQAGQTKHGDPDYRMSLQMALDFMPEGGARTGGVQRWGGGSRGRLIKLPSDMTEEETEARIFGADQPALMAGAVGGKVPFHGDGRPVTVGEIKAMTPVSVRDGVYAFDTGAGFLPAKGGGPWLLDIRRVPRRR